MKKEIKYYEIHVKLSSEMCWVSYSGNEYCFNIQDNRNNDFWKLFENTDELTLYVNCESVDDEYEPSDGFNTTWDDDLQVINDTKIYERFFK